MRAIPGIVIVTLFALMGMMPGGLMDRLIRVMIMIIVVVRVVCDGMDLAVQMMMMVAGADPNPAFGTKADKRIANQQDQTQDLA